MAQLNLDSAKIEETYGVLQKTVNADVGTAFDELASALLPEKGTNPLVDELIGCCKKAQNVYNEEFLESVKGTLENFEATYDISEYLAKRATVGELATDSVGYQNEKVDAGGVIM